MALANFFDKISLGASQLLNNYDRVEFEKILNENPIRISFDNEAVASVEGKLTLELLTRLIARLYPKIHFCGPESHKSNLERLGKSINPLLDFEQQEPSIILSIGVSNVSHEAPVYYLGSDGWDCKFSVHHAVGSNNSANPFGAGAAACMGAANLFRFIFQEKLPFSKIDTDFTYSMLHNELKGTLQQPLLSNINFGEIHLIGLGAIGNSLIWGLGNIQNVTGKIVGIEPETISLSNLQRYILTNQGNVGQPKTIIVSNYLKDANIEFQGHSQKWQEYASANNLKKIENMAVCVDSAYDRIIAQASLPKKVFNAWTQPENIGNSTYRNFGKEPCLSCLYLSSLPKKSRSQEISENLNMPHAEREIRKYLANDYPLDDTLLKLIVDANNISDVDIFKKYLGQSLNIFYSEVVCGGLLMNFNNPSYSKMTTTNAEVPCAFESAMAGLLLGAAIIKDALNLSVESGDFSVRLNLIRPITNYTKFPESRVAQCFCNDADFVDCYNSKWGNSI